MAKKDQGAVDPAARYRLTVSAPFSFGGIGFGPIAEMEVSGELLGQILASDQADKVAGYTAV